MNDKWVLTALARIVLFALTSSTAVTAEQAGEQRVKPSQFPAAVAATVKTNCRNCRVAKATREVENGVTVYDIEFRNGRGEMDIAEDGSMIGRETIVKVRSVPATAMKAIRKAAAGGRIKQIVRDETHAELKDGNIVKLSAPTYVYEADLVKRGRVAEVEVSPEGEITEPPKWRKKGTKED